MAKKGEKKTDAKNEQQNPPSVQVVAQYIKDLSIENPHSPASVIGGWGAPDTGVQINIRTQPLQDNMYEVALMFRIEAKAPKQENKVAFIVELAYAATVEVKNVPEENVEPILMVEVPKILFPFAREIVAECVIKAGFPPLYLQPISFEAIYMQEVQRRQQEQEKKADNA